MVSHARLMGPTHLILTSVRRRGAAGHLPELGRRLRRSPREGQCGGLLQGGGDGDVRALDGQGQVAGSFLRIADDRRFTVKLAGKGLNFSAIGRGDGWMSRNVRTRGTSARIRVISARVSTH